MATHSSIFAWEIPWTREPGGLKSMVSQRVENILVTKQHFCMYIWGFPGGSEVKASACNAGHLGSIPGSGRSPEEGNGNPLQYFCLGNPMDRGAYWAAVHTLTKNWI